MSGTQGRDPIILEGQAAETSVCSYLSCCRICLHLAGTRRDATLRGGCHPGVPPSPSASDEVHKPPGVGNRLELFPKSGDFKDPTWFKTD